MNILHKILLSIMLIFLIGCNTSSNSVKITNLNPKIEVNNLNKNDNNYSFNIKFNESNNKLINIYFDNITITDCNITSTLPNKIQNNQNLNLNLKCNKELSKLTLNFTEHAEYIDIDTKKIEKKFTKDITFNHVKTEQNSTNIKYAILQPSSITLNKGDKYTFTVYTFDNNNNPLSVNVKIAPPLKNGEMIGSFDNYSVTTDPVNGKATFTYTAPTNLEEDKNLTIPVTFANSVEKNLTINIKKESVNISVLPTKLLIVPNTLNVLPNTTYNIKLYTLDENNRGIPSTIILSHAIDNNDNSWGDFSDYNITTNNNGEAQITFKSVDNIDNLENNISVKFQISNTDIIKNLILQKSTTNNTEGKKYKIKYSLPDSIEVNKQFTLGLNIVNQKDESDLINSSNVNEINITSTNQLIYFENNKSKFNITFNKLNSLSIEANTNIYSGIDILEVKANISNNEKNETITKNIPVVIISGPVNTISINDNGSSFNSETGLFEHMYTIHAVDKYSNPVQNGTKIKVGAIVNKIISSNNGAIKPNTYNSEFNDTTLDFNDSIINDTLVIFADNSHQNPSYLGGWIIDDVLNNHKLTLLNTFEGNATTNLSYVVGDERRLNSCESTLAVADFDNTDKTYSTTNGLAFIKLIYDPYLTGHTITLYANSFQEKRVGISKKEILFNNKILTYEENEDTNKTIAPERDGIWEKKGNNGDTDSGSIYVGTNDGPYNTILVKDKASTLAQQSQFKFKIITPNICTFSDGSTIKIIKTNCSGAANFNVKYIDNGVCKVKLQSSIYEY